MPSNNVRCTCPNCQHPFSTRQEIIGRKGTCPKCRAPLIVKAMGGKIVMALAGQSGDAPSETCPAATPTKKKTKDAVSSPYQQKRSPALIFAVIALVVLVCGGGISGLAWWGVKVMNNLRQTGSLDEQRIENNQRVSDTASVQSASKSNSNPKSSAAAPSSLERPRQEANAPDFLNLEEMVNTIFYDLSEVKNQLLKDQEIKEKYIDKEFKLRTTPDYEIKSSYRDERTNKECGLVMFGVEVKDQPMTVVMCYLAPEGTEKARKIVDTLKPIVLRGTFKDFIRHDFHGHRKLCFENCVIEEMAETQEPQIEVDSYVDLFNEFRDGAATAAQKYMGKQVQIHHHAGPYEKVENVDGTLFLQQEIGKREIGDGSGGKAHVPVFGVEYRLSKEGRDQYAKLKANERRNMDLIGIVKGTRPFADNIFEGTMLQIIACKYVPSSKPRKDVQQKPNPSHSAPKQKQQAPTPLQARQARESKARQEAAAEAKRRQDKYQADLAEAKTRRELNGALSLLDRGFKEEAKKRLQAIVDKYPDSEAAQKAKQQLDKMAK